MGKRSFAVHSPFSHTANTEDMSAGAISGSGRRPGRSTPPIDVVTWNVLSPHLCNKKVFPECDDAALDAEERRTRTRHQLRQFITERKIICLQEVCNQWSSEFRTLFTENGYEYVDAIHGRGESDCFGVAIASPMDRYRLIGTDFRVLAESIGREVPASSKLRQPMHAQWTLELTIVSLFHLLYILLNLVLFLFGRGPHVHPYVMVCYVAFVAIYHHVPWFKSAILPKTTSVRLQIGTFGAAPNVIDRLMRFVAGWMSWPLVLFLGLVAWCNVRTRYYQSDSLRKAEESDKRVITLVLERLGKPGQTFAVTTYHMPCAFRQPLVMYLHLQALLRHHARWCPQGRGVLAGDFNLQPDSPLYTYMVTGRDASGALAVQLRREGFDEPIVEELEPLVDSRTGVPLTEYFTCRAMTAWNGHFRGVIDYILYSGLLLDAIDRQPVPKDTDLPTTTCPSDHTWISASLLYDK
jgi:endonuclease/exonuclease/phosphatase family metal-dependent hydrolase